MTKTSSIKIIVASTLFAGALTIVPQIKSVAAGYSPGIPPSVCREAARKAEDTRYQQAKRRLVLVTGKPFSEAIKLAYSDPSIQRILGSPGGGIITTPDGRTYDQLANLKRLVNCQNGCQSTFAIHLALNVAYSQLGEPEASRRLAAANRQIAQEFLTEINALKALERACLLATRGW